MSSEKCFNTSVIQSSAASFSLASQFLDPEQSLGFTYLFGIMRAKLYEIQGIARIEGDFEMSSDNFCIPYDLTRKGNNISFNIMKVALSTGTKRSQISARLSRS